MKKVVFFITAVIFLCINTSVFAQLKLDKYQKKLEITPGETITGFIIVENGSNEQITVNTAVDDIVALPPFDGNREFKPAGSTPYSFAEWVTISPAIFNISALGKQKVNYTINVPAEAKGGYYGTIFFEKVKSSPVKGVGVVFRMGCTLSLVTKNAIYGIKIEDVSLTKNSIKGKFLNTGDVILNSGYSYYLMDQKSNVFDRGKVSKPFILPPGEKVSFEINIAKKVKKGNYGLVINFNLTAGGSLIKEIELIKDDSGDLKLVNIAD